MLLTHAQTDAMRLPLLMTPNFKLLTEVRLNPKMHKRNNVIQTKRRDFARNPIDFKTLTI